MLCSPVSIVLALFLFKLFSIYLFPPHFCVDLPQCLCYAFFMIKNKKDFETWLGKPIKPLNDIEFKKLAISYLRYLKDKKNNK